MALTDYWQVKDNMVAGQQRSLNVYHVKRILAGATAQMVAEAFDFSILTLNYLGMQATNLDRSTIEVENLGDPTDFVAYDSSAKGGTDTGDTLVTFNAASIQFNRTRIDMKHGQKRFVVGNDADELLGVWNAAFLAQLALLGQTIIDPWTTLAAPAVDVCSFVILKRFCVDPLQDPCQVYRLPNTDTEVDSFHYVPLTFTVRDRIRSQVSRKVLV